MCVQLTFGPQLDGSQSEPEVMNVWHIPEDLLGNSVAYKKQNEENINIETVTAKRVNHKYTKWHTVIHHKNTPDEYSCQVLILQVEFFNLMLTIEAPGAVFIYALQQVVIEKVQIFRNAPPCHPGKD